MSAHVFTTEGQPATDFIDANIDPPARFQYHPRCTFRCLNCRKLRWAQNLIAHVYYDGTRFYCRTGCGCKAKR